MMAIAMMMVGTVLPNAASSTAARAMPGNAIRMSMRRMISSFTALLDVAAREPSRAPATMARMTAPRPIISEDCAPKRMREKMSRPRRSVPKKCSAPGGVAGMKVSSGSCGAMTGAKTAASTIMMRKRRAMREPHGRALKRMPGALSRSASLLRMSYTVLIRGLMSK